MELGPESVYLARREALVSEAVDLGGHSVSKLPGEGVSPPTRLEP